jgi:predicted metal-dependent hydrolase
MIREKLKQAGIELVVTRKAIVNINLQIKTAGELRMSVPKDTTLQFIDEVLEKKYDWILKHNQMLVEREVKIPPDPGVFLFKGEEFQIIDNPLMFFRYKINEQKKIIETGVPLDEDGVLEQIYKLKAQEYIKPLVWHYAQSWGFDIKRVFIRGQISKWGTCSSKGNISLNWKLMMAPVFVIDYLIFHELLHTRHMNHGAVYKNELRQLFPRTDEAELWLKQHNHLLKMF